jgi:uncharacterized protein (TIGR02246 family)
MDTVQTALSVVTAFTAAWNAHDMRALGTLFGDEAEFVNVYGLWTTGRDGIEKVHAAVHETVFRESHLTAIETRVTHFDARICSVHWRWMLTGIRAPNGSHLPDRKGIMLFVLTASNERWMIAIAQNTDTVEPPR